MEEDGTVTAKIAYRGKATTLSEGGSKPVKVVVSTEGEEDHPPRCGPLEFDFRVWDREWDDLGESVTESRRSRMSARISMPYPVQVYRDGLRVLMQDQDWLDLNYRRVQTPTLRSGRPNRGPRADRLGPEPWAHRPVESASARRQSRVR